MYGSTPTALSQISCVLRWLGTSHSVSGLQVTALLHISWVLRRSETNSSPHGFFSNAISHISWDLRWSGIKKNIEDLVSDSPQGVLNCSTWMHTHYFFTYLLRLKVIRDKFLHVCAASHCFVIRCLNPWNIMQHVQRGIAHLPDDIQKCIFK